MFARRRALLFRLSFAVGAVLLLSAVPARAAEPVKPKITLDEAYRQWHAGLTSLDAAKRTAALESMLPTKADVAYLFPEHEDKLWPRMETYFKKMHEHIDEFSKEFERKGKIEEIDAIDCRQTGRRYQEVLTMIPAELPVYRLSVKGTNSGGGSSSYLYRGGRWFWYRGLEGTPEMLKQLK